MISLREWRAPDNPRFADWKLINAQALVTGAVAAQPDGRLKIDFRLWDVLGGTQMAGFSYNTPPANWRIA